MNSQTSSKSTSEWPEQRQTARVYFYERCVLNKQQKKREPEESVAAPLFAVLSQTKSLVAVNSLLPLKRPIGQSQTDVIFEE